MSNLEQSSSLKIQLFGPFQAMRNGVSLAGLHLREGERVLAYLTLHAGEPVASLDLAKRFWPSEAEMALPGQGDFPCVRQALHSLRQALGPDAFRLTRPQRAVVMLDLEGIDADVRLFDHLMRREGEDAGRAWEAAVALYRGPVLATWNDAWAVEARARRKREVERALRRLARQELLRGDGPHAERWMRQLLASRPDDEETGRDLLRLLGAEGRHLDIREVQESLEIAARAAGRFLEPDTVELFAALRKGWERTPIALQSAAAPSPAATSTFSAIGAASTPRDDSPLSTPPTAEFATLPMEPAGGAVPVDSRFYIEREADRGFHAALARRDSIVLVKGARQVGKTSLLARGLQRVRQTGAHVVFTDFQKLNETQFVSPDALYMALGAAIAVQLDLDVSPRQTWDPDFGPNMNLEMFLRRHILRAFPEPLVWGLDEVDRLFACPFGSEVFGLFRSWHNERSLDPSGPWARLTLAIAYATEAHLFIADLNQSPFNVGTRLTLEDFTQEQVADLNRRYGRPLSDVEVGRLHILVGGHPYLVRRSLDEVVRGLPWEHLEGESDQEEGPFGDHLRRLSLSLSRAPELLAVLRGVLSGEPCGTAEAFYRLRTAGVMAGAIVSEARFRCPLYIQYLRRFLA